MSINIDCFDMMLYALQKAKETGNEEASDILDRIKTDGSIDSITSVDECRNLIESIKGRNNG